MNKYEEEIEGQEFDWFATDNEGNIAIFATAGEDNIPQAVIYPYSDHDAVSEHLETPNWGSSDIWKDYAKLGLFVFDWQFPGGPFLSSHFIVQMKFLSSSSTRNRVAEGI